MPNGIEGRARARKEPAFRCATVIEFGADHWREAISAWWRFGRTRHPARLNFGDCLAYAAARLSDQPLLAKGDDFPLTDVDLA
jgi:ribonuclease VapC